MNKLQKDHLKQRRARQVKNAQEGGYLIRQFLPGIFNPNGSVNEDAIDERARRIKLHRKPLAKEAVMTPGVEKLKRERRERIMGSWFRWIVCVVLVVVVAKACS